jgi:hypothetical protein
MTDERRSGIALIAGSAAMIITMGFHPHGKIGPEELDHVVPMLIGVHVLALASIPVIFLGAWGMTRLLAGPDRLAWAGLVLFAMGSIAVMNAAVFDGLMAPYLMKQIVAATTETRDSWQMFMKFNFQMNQAFARVYAVASSPAVVLWSVSILRSRAMGRGIGIYGCVLGAVTAVGILSGLLSPSWHGFGMLILGQAIWFFIIGGGLWTSGARPSVQAEQTPSS